MFPTPARALNPGVNLPGFAGIDELLGAEA
jgi:hypothetical protein